jgi:chorismate mutase
MAEKPDVTSPATARSREQRRQRIDQIDTQLMKLLNSRSACAVEIGRIKKRLGLPAYSPEREAWILERVMRESPGPLQPEAVRRVFERIIDESRRLERLMIMDGEQAVLQNKPEGEG